MVATQLKSRQVLGLNQRQYERLKTALQLNLRRQLLIAVCDNDMLQARLVDGLQSDLAASDSIDEDSGRASLAYLHFDPQQPDLLLQLVQWLKRAPKPTPHLQVVGLDAMTQQPMRSQNHFLRSLENLHSLLPHFDSSLVLWLSWPWYRTLQQSAPQLWEWRSGVFTFVSKPVDGVAEPAPAPPVDGLYGDGVVAQSGARSADIWQILNEDLAQLEQSAAAEASSVDAASAAPAPPAPAEPMTAAEPDITTLDNPLEVLAQREAEGVPAEELIAAYRTLGFHYRDRIEAGEMAPGVLTIAIETFERYLHWLPTEDEQRAAGLNDLGTLYWLQAQQQGDRQALIAGMKRSVELYEAGLACAQVDAESTSRLHGNLGAVHSALANYADSVTHLQAAVTAYRQALPFCPAATHPQEYGTLHNSLGSVYWKLAYYEQPKPHLHSAIAAYNEALSCHNPKTSPLDYAAVQNNLGIAYWSLSRHERPIFLLKHAIAAYRDALKYRTPTTDAAACASTYNNLGTAFWELANHPEAPEDPEGRSQQNAVIAYEAALKASELGPSNLDLVSIRHCLGSIYDKLARIGDSQLVAANLERGLNHYVAALKHTPETASTYEPIFKALVRNVSTHYELLGLEGQQEALKQVPAELLPKVMLKL